MAKNTKNQTSTEKKKHESIIKTLTSLQEVKNRQIIENDKQKDKRTWITVKGLIELLPNHPAKVTIYKWIKQKKLKYIKIGREYLFNKNEIKQIFGLNDNN